MVGLFFMSKPADFLRQLVKVGLETVTKSPSGYYDGIIGPTGVFQGPELIPSNYYGDSTGMWFFGNNGFNYKFEYKNNSSALNAYVSCAPLTAIINRKAKSYINGKTFVMNTKGKESDSPDAKRIRALMKNPNPIQTWKQFEAQQKIYIELFGYCMCMPIINAGFTKRGPVEAKQMWNIPPFLIEITPVKKLFYETDTNNGIAQVKLSYQGLQTLLDVQNLLIFKDITPSAKSQFIPESRVCSLETQINNIIGAYESRHILINRRGAMGILSNSGKDVLGSLAIDKNEKQLLQDGFSNYGLRKEQWQVIVTNAALQWQQMGYPTKDLMLFEEIQDDIMRICDSYDYPYRLLASEKSASYNDVSEFTKGLYQDAIMPESDSIYEQWNTFFKTEDLNLNIIKDYSHVPCLQEDKVNLGKSRWYTNQAMLIEFQNNLITVNQWLDANGMDALPEPKGSMFYSDMIQAGIVFGSGASGSSQPVDDNNSNNSQNNNQQQNNNS